jgi:hypothetical protein
MMTKAILTAVATAVLGLAQGALPTTSSYYYTPTYKDVTKVGTGTGWLAFDAKSEMRFVPKNGEEVRIPYKAIKDLEYERALEAPAAKSQAKAKSKWALPFSMKKLNFISRHQVKIQYDVAEGKETATLWLDGSNYEKILGTLQAKTGLAVKRTGETW